MSYRPRSGSFWVRELASLTTRRRCRCVVRGGGWWAVKKKSCDIIAADKIVKFRGSMCCGTEILACEWSVLGVPAGVSAPVGATQQDA